MTNRSVDVLARLGELDDAILEMRGVLDAERVTQLRLGAFDAAAQARSLAVSARLATPLGPDDAAVVFLLFAPDGLGAEERAVYMRHLRLALAAVVPLSPESVARVALRRVPR